jgi:hypothetical protein
VPRDVRNAVRMRADLLPPAPAVRGRGDMVEPGAAGFWYAAAAAGCGFLPADLLSGDALQELGWPRNYHLFTTNLPPFYHNYVKRFYLNITPRFVFFLDKFRIVSPNLHDQEIRFVESVFMIANRTTISLNLPKYFEIPYCPS